MDINQDFAYFKDTNGNAHSAGYVFNQNCIKNNQSGGGYMKDLVIPASLFSNYRKNTIHKPYIYEGVVNSDLFDKLFENVCLHESKKKTRRNKLKKNKKTRKL